MLRPAMSEILERKQDCYSFVVAVAKRAREICEEADAQGETIIEKPVSLALHDFINGDYVLVEPEEIRNL